MVVNDPVHIEYVLNKLYGCTNEHLHHDPILPEGLYKPFKDFAEAAIADGYISLPGGPWGKQIQNDFPGNPFNGNNPAYCKLTGQLASTGERKQGDRSLHLIKVIDGKQDVIIFLMDRDMFYAGQDRKSMMDRLTGKQKVQREASAWFDEGRTAFKLPQLYSAEAIDSLRSRCSFCNQKTPQEELKRIGFAQKVCRQCDTKALRDEIEFSGWCD